MKNILLLFVLSIFSYQIHSQDKVKKELLFELQNKKININIDKNVFKNVQKNMYVSQNPNALILGLFLPISYENQKVKINNISTSDNLKFVGEKTINKEKVLLKEGIINKKGIDYLKHVYYIKYDDNICIELTTMLPYKADDQSKKMIENIVYSVLENN